MPPIPYSPPPTTHTHTHTHTLHTHFDLVPVHHLLCNGILVSACESVNYSILHYFSSSLKRDETGNIISEYEYSKL